ncbi:MAG: ImmA/IrrE family metallo-endopeptidase, partial [Clostridia bacterium]|nr:ImmA/IrrE family metallo-endopeptidase [Clostridia bacterium]
FNFGEQMDHAYAHGSSGIYGNVRPNQQPKYNDGYEYEEEYEANLFASMILMPERSFRMMYHKFADENNSINKENSIYDRIILKLMNYYQVPYMAVLIRCFELELGEWNVQRLLEEANSNTIQEKFEALWLDKELLEATGKDDFSRIEGMVKKFGDEAVNGTFMNEAAVERALQNMRALYLEIRGE